MDLNQYRVIGMVLVLNKSILNGLSAESNTIAICYKDGIGTEKMSKKHLNGL